MHTVGRQRRLNVTGDVQPESGSIEKEGCLFHGYYSVVAWSSRALSTKPNRSGRSATSHRFWGGERSGNRAPRHSVRPSPTSGQGTRLRRVAQAAEPARIPGGDVRTASAKRVLSACSISNARGQHRGSRVQIRCPCRRAPEPDVYRYMMPRHDMLTAE